MSDAVRSHNRKHEFVMTALELFYKKGYENTTIKDIIDEMGVSKGAFYHYFESKEDVVVAIAKAFKDRSVQIINEIFSRSDLSAVDKMNKVFESVNEYRVREGRLRTELRDAFEREGNLKLQRKIYDVTKQDVVGLYKELIDTGVEEGVFDDPGNSWELADFFIDMMFSLNTAIHNLEKDLYDEEKEVDYQEFLRRLEAKVLFYQAALERVFQLRKGAFDLRTPYLKRFEQAE
jgi:AcrR family transcriptional regulator